ncbi:high light inducible protein [Prochlorococcus phage P-HM2]|uniref:High light inducible protein n=1 Tax=Prochlorococcus phage P-HM2 TaxID=445696 RepID=E3ST51_9CAUD|nr:high light inducible protein [Prochlorococcus phage P-HM2]ADO99979.1 high light inducible protein [Prochlorococcus phage P-HM2]
MGSNARFRSSSRCIRNNRTNHTRYFLMNDKQAKAVAEKLNGRLAMIGIIAGIGAYLTTGQLIPGFV